MKKFIILTIGIVLRVVLLLMFSDKDKEKVDDEDEITE